MRLEVNEFYCGFKVIQSDWIEEVHSQSYLMEHIKSGARLFYLANEDDNKVFYISFRTPPSDDTGVAHILEHSSLCGSRKYRLKEPFVDLVKGSLNTFLNAMTYPDKTVYPIASRNNKDFRNLMDVYLDAVFYPLFYENKYTLLQEGWHYELEDAASELAYNGVVYNEMKGVYSTADAYLENEALKALFPDTCYRFESGGYPASIPQLTQEKFEAFHKNYYPPENSYIFLYGDLDILDTLSYLDTEYLGNFSRSNSLSIQIEMQKPLSRTKEVEAFYPVAKDENCEGKTYHELSVVTGNALDVQTIMALRLLEVTLLESESSPLRRALMEAKVGQNISGSFSSSMIQPVFSVRVSGSEKEQRDNFLSVIYRTLQGLTINGIDKKLLEANLNSMEFRLREADFGAYPKGLIYGLSILDNWLYGGNPAESLRYSEYLLKMRQGIGSGYYENLIENYLLDNSHKVLVTLIPQPGKEDVDRSEEKDKLSVLKEKLSSEEIKRYVAECKELHRLQSQPDSEEARAAIPSLERKDIRREIDRIQMKVEDKSSNTILFVPANTNKITYTSFYFDITGIEAAKLKLCFLLSDLLGKFDTQEFTYKELATNSMLYTGGISFSAHAYSKVENADKYRIYFAIKAKVLNNNLPKLLSIVEAITLKTKFDNLERFRELVGEIRTDWDNDFFSKGQSIAIARLCSYCSSAARANEQDWFSYYQFIKQLDANFGDLGPSVLAELRNIMQILFQKSSYILAYSCEENEKENVKVQCLEFLGKLPEAAVKKEPCVISPEGINEGITTSGKVQYVVAGGNFVKFGHKYTGAMRVLETILRYEYLWTKIRIQGGAYGATARFETNGLSVLASYRDPQLAKSIDAYRALPGWLKTLDLSAKELDKYVIGTISSMDVPLTNSMRLERACTQYLKDISDDFRQKIRNEVLDITNNDLQALGTVLEDILSEGLICVVGSRQSIEENQMLFKEIINQ